METAKYALRDRADLSEPVNHPLRNNKRIKFTCFDCSAKYLVFGANSGSLYLYERKSTAFLALVPSQLGVIGKVSISQSEKQIAIGNQSGSIGVLLELDPPNVREIISTELTLTSDEEQQLPPDAPRSPPSAFVTSFCWTEDDKELYCGDSRGIVSLIQFSLFMGRNILNISLHPVLLLENRIVQIDRYKDLLLVSTLSKCVLCNTAREEFKQIGNRPREGQYGASFVIAQPSSIPATPSPPLMIVDEEDVRIFCSRPGSRLWEADLEGNVIRTHQFKPRSGQPRHVRQLHRLPTDKTVIDSAPADGTMMVVPFQVLYSIRRQLLLVHDRSQLLIIDPLHSTIVLRTDEFSDITHVAVVDEWIYLLSGENRLFQVRVEFVGEPGDEDVAEERLVAAKEGGMQETSPKNHRRSTESYELRKNHQQQQHQQKQGVYILESAFNNNGKESPLMLSTEATIKEALVSVVRGKYGRNIKQMFMGYEQQSQKHTGGAPERPKTLNLTKIYEPSRNNNGNGNALLAELGIDAGDDSYVDDMGDNEDESLEELVRTRKGQTMNGSGSGAGRKKFSTSLLNGYETSEDDATVRNLYLIYRSSIISNLNFADRYAKIFDDYGTEAIVRLLHKLETLMEENEEPEARLKCTRIYFDYLKPELLWEIDAVPRQFIKEGFIVCNTVERSEQLDCELGRCDGCGYYLRAPRTCHYRDIGISLMRYFWSRREYGECFALVKQVPHLWRTVTRYYIQDRRQDKVVACVWNLADRELFERAAGEMFEAHHWRQLFELVLSYYRRNEMICLNCDKRCTTKTTPTIQGNGSSQDGEAQFRQWNYLLEVALEHLEPAELLSLLNNYTQHISKGAISTSFYIRCLLLQAK
ncbi:Hermansky-Pudlak syndrome 5 protein homolog [Anopheles darlingi]|uniref:Hermansky-Pudlak syndrome 5 protein homolog n=1 Tax=Anopheles darlingi TaxID=43151 RepID=UPI00210045EE|nr:Hermansky-Pudlak syndrome 5 protein homolog [Anopheles darlingi]